MAQLYPVEVRLTEEEVVALDEACAIWGLAGGDGRSRFIQHCLRYGLLSLLDAGVLEFPEAADPEFVRHYREMEARLSAAGASTIFTSPGFRSSAWAMGCSGADGAGSIARASRPSWVNPVLHRLLPVPRPLIGGDQRRGDGSEDGPEFHILFAGVERTGPDSLLVLQNILWHRSEERRVGQ